MKDVIEKNDGYRWFYSDGKRITREHDIQLIFRLTWYDTTMDVNCEPNNGRGFVDYSISNGAQDKTLVEFKLVSNTRLKKNLQHQVAIYETAYHTTHSIKVILFFDDVEHFVVNTVLKELKLEKDESILLIDGRKNNKLSASRVG